MSHAARIDSLLPGFALKGVDTESGNNIVVSLTSFPARLHELHYSLFTLLTQSLKPQQLVLWLGREEFPGGLNDLPPAVLALRDNGLDIRWTKNTRQYKKLVPALAEFGDKIIVTADDDVFYPRNWLQLLYLDYLKNNGRPYVYAHRAHRLTLHTPDTPDAEGRPRPYAQWLSAQRNHPGASFLNFATGSGGVLYPPGVLHPDALNGELALELAPYADDVFFWAMAVRNGTRTRVVENNLAGTYDLEPGGGSLYQINVLEGKNDEQLAALLERFPEILPRLQREWRRQRKSS